MTFGLFQRLVRRRRVGWLALVAMLALALAPTVSRALAASGGDAIGVEICTSRGAPGLVQEGSGEPAAPGSTFGSLAHCGHCLLSADVLGMPPAPLAMRTGARLGAELPPRFLHVPRTHAAWCRAQARAPPATS